jgi:hypothetical protein
MRNSRETGIPPIINHFVYTHFELFLWAHEYRAVVKEQPCRAVCSHFYVRRGVKNSPCDARDGRQWNTSEEEFDRKRNDGGVYLGVKV